MLTRNWQRSFGVAALVSRHGNFRRKSRQTSAIPEPFVTLVWRARLGHMFVPMLCLHSFPRKGVSLGSVGRIKT